MSGFEIGEKIDLIKLQALRWSSYKTLERESFNARYASLETSGTSEKVLPPFGFNTHSLQGLHIPTFAAGKRPKSIESRVASRARPQDSFCLIENIKNKRQLTNEIIKIRKSVHKVKIKQQNNNLEHERKYNACPPAQPSSSNWAQSISSRQRLDKLTWTEGIIVHMTSPQYWGQWIRAENCLTDGLRGIIEISTRRTRHSEKQNN